MRINKVNKELFYLLINEFEKQYNREDGQSKYIEMIKDASSEDYNYIKKY